MKTLYIIDGHAQIYAAYYAPLANNLSAPGGEPIKAVYIFTTMLMKIINERKPDMLVVAMDAPGPSFRHAMYDQYKANRQAMPEDLPGQIARIDQILQAMNIPVIRLPGYEADDIIGTMTLQAGRQDYKCYICSKDKDLEQLISDNVILYDPRGDEETNAAALLEKKGLRPEQVIDLLALAGDTSDNVPGVPMVGPGIATKWISEYGSLDNLLAHKDELTGKRGESFRASLDILELSRKLVTIDRQVPLPVDWNNLSLRPWNNTQLADLFRLLGFNRLLDQYHLRAPVTPPDLFNQPASSNPVAIPIAAPATPPPAVKIPASYHLIDTPELFANFLHQLKQQTAFAIDTETTGLNPAAVDLVGISISWQAHSGYYLAMRSPLGQKHLDWPVVREQLQALLESPAIKKTGQNIKFDLIVLRKAGIELQGVEFDTMLACYLLDSDRSHGMDAMARDFLNHETIKLESLLGKGKNQLTFDMVDTAQAAEYSAEDADITWRLRAHLEPQLTDPQLRKLFDETEMPLVMVLAEMEYNGIALDIRALKSLSTRLGDRLEELTRTIHEYAGCAFNIDSPKQMGEILFGKLQLPTGKKTQTGFSTDQSVLESLQGRHPIITALLEHRQLSKLKSTYIDKLPSMINPLTGRIHCSFNQTATATGRLSSSDPNLQNIPIRTDLGRLIRKAFVAPNSQRLLLSADYSQIELRMLAHLSGDQSLRAAFAAGADIHRFVASQVYGVKPEEVTSEQRGRAKAVNFGVIYGQTAYGLSQSLGISQSEAQQFIDDYFRRYGTIRGFMDQVIADAGKQGFVRTILGRRRLLPDIKSRNQNQRKLAERMAVNTVVQGSAADLIKVAMIKLHHRIRQDKLDYKLMLQVHDELVLEIPRDQADQAMALVREAMTSALPLEVPIVVDAACGPNWMECK